MDVDLGPAIHFVHGGMVGRPICGAPFRETH